MVQTSNPDYRLRDRERFTLVLALILLLALSLPAQCAPPQRVSTGLIVWGETVKLPHGLLRVDGALHIAVADLSKAFGKESPYVGCSSDSATLQTPGGGKRHVSFVLHEGNKYVGLEAVVGAMGAKGALNDEGMSYLVQACVERIEWKDGACLVYLSHKGAKWSAGRLENPGRLFVDIPNATLSCGAKTISVSGGGISRIRVGQCNARTVRVVFDLNSAAQIAIRSAKEVPLKVERVNSGLRIIPTVPVTAGSSAAQGPAKASTQVGKVTPSKRTPTTQKVTDAVQGVTAEIGPLEGPLEVNGADFMLDSDGRRRVRILTSRAGGYAATARYLRQPSRISIDIPGSACNTADSQVPVIDDLVSEIRFGQQADGARVVVELNDDAYYRIFRDPESYDLLLEIDERPGAGGLLQDKRIVVDPGHGKQITGARRKHWSSGALMCEEDLNLDIARRLADLLSGEGVPVFLTRDDNQNLGPTQAEDLQGRVDFAASVEADLFVSIHCNASGANVDNTRCGTETYFCSPGSFWLADTLQTYLVNRLGTADRGTKIAGFKVIRDTTMASVLVELAFINNPGDQDRLIDPEFRQKAAEALFDALKAYVEGSPVYAGAGPGVAESRDQYSGRSGGSADNQGSAKPSKPEYRGG